MKKYFMIALVLVLLTLSACGTAPEPVPTESQPEIQSPEVLVTEPKTDPYAALPVYTMLGLKGEEDLPAQRDQLTPIWREKTGVRMETVTIADYENYDDYLKNALKNDTLPDVLALSEGIFDVPERMKLLEQENALKYIDYDTARNNMPMTAVRLETMGVSFDDWFYANADEDGLWHAVPQLPDPLFESSVRPTRFGVDQTPLELSYFWVRDDWMTAVNNYVTDEVSFRRLYEVFADNMTIDMVCDFMPVTLEDWLRYLDDVQDYAYANFQVITPVMPTYGDSAGSVVWSLYGASGLCWQDLLAEYPNNLISGGKMFSYYAQTDGWKAYIRWLNQCVNLDYTDLKYSVFPTVIRPELAGEQYAVLNEWIEPPQGISPITNQHYGWRYYPVLTDEVVSQMQDNTTVYLTLTCDGAAAFNADSVDDDELALLLRWVDWNYSLEASQLRQWGDGLSEGSGTGKRFLYQYENVASAMLGDTQYASAAWEYGLVNVLEPGRTYWNHEIYGVGGQATAQHPFYTYSMMELPYDQKYFVTYKVKQYLMDQVLEMRYVRVRDDRAYADALAQLEDLMTSYKTAFADEIGSAQQEALAKAIMAEPDQFELYYNQYLSVYNQSETRKTYEPMIRECLTALSGVLEDRLP